MPNDSGFRGSRASKERWWCGTHFPGVFLECAASRGKPFCINDCRRPTILHLFHASESHSFQPRPSAAGLQRRCPAEMLRTFHRTLIFFFLSLFPHPLSLVQHYLGQPSWKQIMCWSFRRQKGGGWQSRDSFALVYLSSVRRWICSRLSVTEMLCDINHITVAWLNWWWICWWSPIGFGNYDMQLLSTVTLDQSYRFTLLTKQHNHESHLLGFPCN